MGMSLAEICEPFFLFVCRLNSAARKGVPLDERHIRSQLDDEIDGLRTRAADAGNASNLRRQVELIERPLIYFFDSMMVRSRAGDHWQELSVERGWRGYEQDFFVILDETLREKGKDATERLEVFFTCLGLGFEGFFEGQPEKIAEYKNDIAQRLRADRLIDASLSNRLCPEAYENIDESMGLIKPVGGTIGGVGIVVVGLLVILILTIFVGYAVASKRLQGTLERITKVDQQGAES
ncbi:MAG: DotU family type IV/VI secretion system protein [Planctomycetota bacterium]|nr:DotU family type IV/VI secretion system protein [Planctomycetota bacterium]